MNKLYDTGKWDVFISHAKEDKDDIARPLAKCLKKYGLDVWFDEFTLKAGDSLSRSINYGIAHSKYGIIIISKHFLAKKWPQDELAAIMSKEDATGKKVLLPVWHKIMLEDIKITYPILADRIAIDSNIGIPELTEKLMDAMYRKGIKISERLKKSMSLLVSSEDIRKNLEYILLDEDYPITMSLDGDFTQNPIWNKISHDELDAMKMSFHPSNPKGPILKVGDIFLIRADDQNHAPRLLTYYSDKPHSGWQAWLYPFRFYSSGENEADRQRKNEKDLASYLGLDHKTVMVSSLGAHYMISVKPDPGYNDVKIYIFKFCSVRISKPPNWLSTTECVYPLDEGERKFRWFHPEDLEREGRTMLVDGDVIKAIHHFFGTTIPDVPESVPLGFLVEEPLLKKEEGLIVHESLGNRLTSFNKYKSNFDSDANLHIVKSSDYFYFRSYDTRNSPMYLFTTYPVIRILPIKIRKGMKWEDKGKSSGIPVMATSAVYSTDEVIDVPAGTFDSCVEVRTTFCLPKNPELTHYKTKSVFWKEGVGPIRIVVNFEDSSPCIGELVNFNVAESSDFWPISKGNNWVYRWNLSRENNSSNVLVMDIPGTDVDEGTSNHVNSL